MGEPLSIVASSIALAQITDRVISLCKFYIQTARDAPDDLRVILVETSALKMILENLKFLSECDDVLSSALGSLTCKDGVIDDCRRALVDLEKLFPSDHATREGPIGGKRQKVRAALDVLAWPLKATKAKRLLDEVMRHKLTITTAVTTGSAQDIKSIKNTTKEMHNMITESQKHKVLKWLVHTDPSSLHQRAWECHEPATCDWIFHLPEWTKWLEGGSRCLWIHGIPGAGKTVLVSRVAEWIRQQLHEQDNDKQALAKYYCYFGHGQDEAEPFLGWILSCLCRQADVVPPSVYALYRNGGHPSLAEFLDGIVDILTEFGTVFIVLDAMDESISRSHLLGVLKVLATDHRFSKIKILASSREYIDIEIVMDPISVSVSMGNEQVRDDIRQCVLSLMKNNPRFARCGATLIDEIGEAVSRGAQGMFRWTVLALSRVQYALEKRTSIDMLERNTIERALKNFPKDLDETYNRIFDMIPEEDLDFVYYALHWIRFHQILCPSCSDIPCFLLLEAVENSMGKSRETMIDRYYDEEILRDLCGCLLTFQIDDVPFSVDHQGCKLNESGDPIITVSYAHYTVLEYMKSHRTLGSNIDLSLEESKLKEGLLKTILWESCQPENCFRFEARQEALTLNSASGILGEEFSTYCVTSLFYSIWDGARSLTANDGLRDLALTLVNPTRPHFAKLQAGLQKLNGESLLIELYSEGDLRRMFWDIEWYSPVDNDHAIYVLNALMLFDSCDSHFVSRVMRDVDTSELLSTRFTFMAKSYSSFSNETETFLFDGSLIEIVAQLGFGEEVFLWLLEHATGYFDPSTILALCIGMHHPHKCGLSSSGEITRDCHDACPLKALLKLGADPNAVVYKVTPLQIAVECTDIAAVKSLLLAGADPNVNGNQRGLFFRHNTILKPLNSLLGYSPLSICRRASKLEKLPGQWRDKHRRKVEELLLHYDAEERDESCFVTGKASS